MKLWHIGVVAAWVLFVSGLLTTLHLPLWAELLICLLAAVPAGIWLAEKDLAARPEKDEEY